MSTLTILFTDNFQSAGVNDSGLGDSITGVVNRGPENTDKGKWHICTYLEQQSSGIAWVSGTWGRK